MLKDHTSVYVQMAFVVMRSVKCLLLSFSLVLVAAWNGYSQINLIPLVTIEATQPFASWSGTTGTFTVFRDGPTNQTLNVFYLIGGTATNGVDYGKIGNWVMIPAGVRTNTITINPINTGQTNVETVVLKLSPSLLGIAQNYAIGYPDAATVYISPAGVTNIPPNVRIFAPTNGAVFFSPPYIELAAFAWDPDGFVTSVEFFAGSQSLGVVSNGVIVDPPFPDGAGPGSRALFLTWSNPPPGSYVLTAKATDNGGASTVSDPVNIMVSQGPPPPPTNFPPLVRIASPANGAIFRAPVNVPLYAYAWDRDGSVTSVEFFAGTNSLGLGRGLCLLLGPTSGWPGFSCPTNFFILTWSNVPPGSYVLTAVATDNGGASTVSDSVKITVLSSPPPPTNRPAIVSIVATDPLAIEGTNCWPWLGVADAVPTWSDWTGSRAIWKFYTNCGPKNATFTVYRFGDTNEDMTVTYDIGGTATNGTDYVPLPGSVVIPAGQRRAEITVVPIDDGPPDLSSTVVLKLSGSTNYVVGYPQKAAVLILDSQWPHPTSGLLSDRSFHLGIPGPDGAWFHVEYSTNLMNWTSICTNQVIDGSIDFVDPDAPSDQSRFYRTIPEANPPPD
jgi:hypothetical protein